MKQNKMSDDTGDGNAQNGQSGEENTTKQVDTTKLYSTAYNEGKGKTEKDVLSKFEQTTGQSAESLDDVFGWVEESSKKLADSISDPTQTQEYKNLQDTLNNTKTELKDTRGQLTSVQNQYTFDSMASEAFNDVKKASKFMIPESDVKDLFNAKHKVEYENGKAIVKKGDMPLTDDEGNHKTLDVALKEFSKPYIQPKAQGTGGGSGDGSTAKPKFAEFQKLNKAKHYDEAKQLYEQARQAGGFEEPGSPKFD